MVNPHLAYHRNRARQIAHGTWQPWADPAHLRGHVHRLLQTATFQAVAGAAQVGEKTVWEIAYGTRPVIKTDTAHALLAIQPADLRPPRVDANGAMWRLRSLIAIGHTTRRITTALGATSHVIEPLIRGDRATVTVSLRDDIDRLFDAWWDKRPPRRWTKTNWTPPATSRPAGGGTPAAPASPTTTHSPTRRPRHENPPAQHRRAVPPRHTADRGTRRRRPRPPNRKRSGCCGRDPGSSPATGADSAGAGRTDPG